MVVVEKGGECFYGGNKLVDLSSGVVVKWEQVLLHCNWRGMCSLRGFDYEFLEVCLFVSKCRNRGSVVQLKL